MDSSKNIDFDATKKFVAAHANLDEEKRVTTMASFDTCVKTASEGGKIVPAVAFGCMNVALIQNVSRFLQ